jgi:hypothetical protein
MTHARGTRRNLDHGWSGSGRLAVERAYPICDERRSVRDDIPDDAATALSITRNASTSTRGRPAVREP